MKSKLSHDTTTPVDITARANRLFLNSSNCLGVENRMPDYSLATFAANEGGLFSYSGFPVAAFGPDHSGWFVQGHVRSITRVPEPSTLVLLATALIGMLCVKIAGSPRRRT